MAMGDIGDSDFGHEHPLTMAFPDPRAGGWGRALSTCVPPDGKSIVPHGVVNASRREVSERSWDIFIPARKNLI